VFLKAAPSSTARDIEHQNSEHIEYVDLDDPFVIANINTPEEYASLTAKCVR
jgi:molybdopterin-guanine dinucleotide biosynthesis protein A